MSDVFSDKIREHLAQGYGPARWPSWASWASAACNLAMAIALIALAAR